MLVRERSHDHTSCIRTGPDCIRPQLHSGRRFTRLTVTSLTYTYTYKTQGEARPDPGIPVPALDASAVECAAAVSVVEMALAEDAVRLAKALAEDGSLAVTS